MSKPLSTTLWLGDIMKIGELAKRADISTSTINYYVREGLIKPAGITPGGYRIFDEAAIIRLRQIARLKEQRLTLHEIKERLGGVIG